MKNCDLANILGIFDRSLEILQNDLSMGKPEAALKRATDMRKAIAKMLGVYDSNHCSRGEKGG